MICYRDRTYCASEVKVHTCGRVITEEELKHAEEIGLPIAYSNFCTVTKDTWRDRFTNKFTSEWWKGFGTTDDIDKQGIGGIQDFIQEALDEQKREIVEAEIERKKMKVSRYDDWIKKSLENDRMFACTDFISKRQARVEDIDHLQEILNNLK